MKKLNQQIRIWVITFIVLLMLSGITAFPLQTEMEFLVLHKSSFPIFIQNWIQEVYDAIVTINSQYPFLSYGTDWLAFAHICIGIAFIGVLKDPIRNKWIIDWGIICCLLVIPLALIAGPIRNIPFFHQLIDCSFGLFALIPLLIVKRKIKKMEVGS